MLRSDVELCSGKVSPNNWQTFDVVVNPLIYQQMFGWSSQNIAPHDPAKTKKGSTPSGASALLCGLGDQPLGAARHANGVGWPNRASSSGCPSSKHLSECLNQMRTLFQILLIVIVSARCPGQPVSIRNEFLPIWCQNESNQVCSVQLRGLRSPS